MKKDFSEKTTFYITISLFIGIFILPFISFFGVDVDELNPFNNGQKVEVIFETEEDTYKDSGQSSVSSSDIISNDVFESTSSIKSKSSSSASKSSSSTSRKKECRSTLFNHLDIYFSVIY